MHNAPAIELKRDCEATEIPAGTVITLPAGTQVDITQTLGGSYTVRALQGGLFRIAPQNADALGLDHAPAEAPKALSDGPVDEQTIWETLKTCYDPEIPVNIVDLGLVYDLKIEPSPEGGSSVQVAMTLTAQGCGMGPSIAMDAQRRIESLPGVGEAHVRVVWDPPWNPNMISPDGRAKLGMA